MADKIDTVQARAKLKIRHAPYWQRISTGCHIGFRRLTVSSEGSWLLQRYDPDTQKQIRKTIGTLAEHPAHKQFDEAKRQAEIEFNHLSNGGSSEVVTVRMACERYVEFKKNARLTKQAEELGSRFRRHVYNANVADIELSKLNKKHIDQWRVALSNTPVTKNPYSQDPIMTNRSPASINRDMTALRAALNFSHENLLVTTDNAWRTSLKPIKNADRRRTDYLDKVDRTELISNAQADVGLFLRGLSLLPLRPGALAILTSQNYDTKLQVLTIGQDKNGADRKIKLPNDTAKFFKSLLSDQVKQKDQNDQESLSSQNNPQPIFRRKDGSAWNKDSWKKPIKVAANAAQLPETVTAYTLRHSVITDLIVEAKLDLLTVAQISGTSVAMIEKHYGHLRLDHAAKALDTLSI